MNKEVSFPIAKLLKEKGFDAYCDKKYIAQCLWQKPNSREKYKNSEIHKNSGDISAPTIAEVIMWLYEKHGIWISVNKEYHNGVLLGFEAIIDSEDGLIDVGTFATPIKAYEEAIKYALNHSI